MPSIVIVEDQATDRRILAQMAQNLADDVEVEAFPCPNQALDWLRHNQPDLLIVDYRLPRMDGVMFLRACAEFPWCVGVPIVVITAVRDADLSYRALEAGATDFLTKPLDIQACQARCRNLLTLRRQQLTIARHARRLEDARSRTGRALRILSRGNELLITTRSERDLLAGTCRIIADQAGYPLVWAGFWDDDGVEAAVTVPDPPPDARLVDAVRTAPFLTRLRAEGNAAVFNDLAEADGATWAEPLREAGFSALAVVPVRIEGLTDGLLAVYSRTPDVFDQDELEILLRSADTLGHGLAARRAERARARAERDARFLTHFDRLTGLPNRNRLLEWLRGVVEGQSRPRDVAVLVINLDRFKLVNDTAGHEAGDQLLVQVVRRLQAILHEHHLLARQAGDEFALLMPGWPDRDSTEAQAAIRREAVHVAQRIIESFKRPIELAGFEYYLGASVGISLSDGMQTDLQALLRQADTAMRQAKEAGGSSYFFYSGELTERHTRRLSLEGRLRRAIARGDFVLHYQPIVDLNDEGIVGAEALIRWPQDDGSVLPPDAFVPMVEETGLMDALGRWVFQAACEQARTWSDQREKLYLSINLSVHQLLRPRLADDLALIMEASNTPPALLELEVTEGAMMTDPLRTERIIRDLSERGLSIALDDFGIGYSSLSRLKHLPISTIKIDKDFVLGLPNDPADRTMVRSIVQLAENLGVRSLAEGVESARHHDILRRIGCHFGQGFHFGRPCSSAEFPVASRSRATG